MPSQDDSDMLAVLGAPALEQLVELVARDGERMIRTSVRRAPGLPRVAADPAGVEPMLVTFERHWQQRREPSRYPSPSLERKAAFIIAIFDGASTRS